VSVYNLKTIADSCFLFGSYATQIGEKYRSDEFARQDQKSRSRTFLGRIKVCFPIASSLTNWNLMWKRNCLSHAVWLRTLFTQQSAI